MNIEERAAQAAAWKATGQCNCAQAVMKAFEDKLPVDADTLMKLGAHPYRVSGIPYCNATR